MRVYTVINTSMFSYVKCKAMFYRIIARFKVITNSVLSQYQKRQLTVDLRILTRVKTSTISTKSKNSYTQYVLTSLVNLDQKSNIIEDRNRSFSCKPTSVDLVNDIPIQANFQETEAIQLTAVNTNQSSLTVTVRTSSIITVRTSSTVTPPYCDINIKNVTERMCCDNDHQRA